MSEIIIYYGSKKAFQEIHPNDFISLTDVVHEIDKDNKIFKIQVEGQKENESDEIRLFVENLVVSSDEYAGVKEHVIINFNNFLSKLDFENLYLQNPPLQISNQIKRLYPNTIIKYQEYSSITMDSIMKINSSFDNKIIGQEKVKIELLQSLFPLTLKNRKKPVVLLLYGKSGIGKTETAKFISEIIGEPLFRKQFSMFQNSQFATYLFGGAHYEKSFAKDLLDRESNVLLLDEFDKAHSSFYSAFYQLFDEAIYEDQNYYLKLEKSIIICTSNYNTLKDIEDHLGNAIYNRFDNLIKFEDLSFESKQIIGKQLVKEKSKHYEASLPADVLKRLESNFDKCDNVRQISRLIEDTFAMYTIKLNIFE